MNKDDIMKYEVGLYEHNAVAYENVKEMFKEQNRVCIVQATGTGKSFIALQLMYDFLKKNPDKKVKYFAPQKGILKQLKEHIATLNFDTSVFNNVEFLTYSSLLEKSDEQLRNLEVDLMITDEFHRIGAPEWKKRLDIITESHPDLKVFGMSATPVRGRNKSKEEDVSKTFFDGNVANRYELCDAIADGVLPVPNYHIAWTTLEGECKELEQKIKNGNATNEEKAKYEEMLSSIRKKISDGKATKKAEDILENHIKPNGKYIYFCSKGLNIIDLQEDVKKMFSGADCEFYYVHSGEKSDEANEEDRYNFYHNRTSDNRDASNKLRIMFAIDMYNEGIHVPDIDGVIMGRCTSSDILFHQQLGRALAVKNSNDKNFHPLVLDLVNNFSEMVKLFTKVKGREKGNKGIDNLNIVSPKIKKKIMASFGLNDREIDILTELANMRNLPGIKDLSYDELFEKHLQEVYERLKNGRELPSISDNVIPFSDGTKIGLWLSTYRDKLRKMDDDRAKEITEYLDKRKDLSYDELFEKHLQETYELLINEGQLPSTGDNKISFSDGTKIGLWLKTYRDKPKKMDDDRAKAVTEYLDKRKGLSGDELFEKHLQEVYERLKNERELPSIGDNETPFIDGTKIGLWLNMYRDKLRKMDDDRAKVVTEYLDKRKGLSGDELFEKHLQEVYERLKNGRELPSIRDNEIQFSDGTKIGLWLKTYRDKLRKMDDDRAKVITEYLDKRKDSGELFEKHLQETYELLINEGQLPKHNDDETRFNDGTKIGLWLKTYRDKLRKMDDDRAKVVTEYLDKRKGLSGDELFEKCLQEVYERLKNGRELPSIGDNEIPFIDGTKIGLWLSTYRDKLRKMDDDRAKVVTEYLDKRKGLSGDELFEKHLQEVYECLKNGRELPSIGDNEIQFSDGTKIGLWLKTYRDKLRKMDDDRAKKITEFLNYRVVLENGYLQKLYDYLDQKSVIPGKTVTIQIGKEKLKIGQKLYNNRQKIYELYLTGNELAIKIVNKILEINPNYFDKIRALLSAKRDFEESKKEVVENARKVL